MKGGGGVWISGLHFFGWPTDNPVVSQVNPVAATPRRLAQQRAEVGPGSTISPGGLSRDLGEKIAQQVAVLAAWR